MLEMLTDEVRGLRDDLQSYRDSIGQVMQRRLQALVAVTVVVVLASLSIFVGSVWLLRHEQDRSAQVHDIAQAQSCVMARNVQSQVIAALTALHDGEPDVEAALRAMAADPCRLPSALDPPPALPE